LTLDFRPLPGEVVIGYKLHCHSQFQNRLVSGLAVLSHDLAKWSSPPNPPYWGQEQIIWNQVQERLSRLSPNSTRIVVTGSDHDIHVERPDLVIQAV